MRGVLFYLLLMQVSFGGYRQIGDHYSRKNAISSYKSAEKNIQKLIANSVLINSKRRTGVNRGTGFYLGEHKGKHLVLTNSHVMQKDECKGAIVHFMTPGHGDIKFSCEKILLNLYKNQKSDLTLFSINLNPDKILGKGLAIDFFSTPISGEALALVGFGLKRAPRINANLKLKRFSPLLSMDDDCVLMSPTGVTVFFGGSSQVDHTIALGCDVATGDSGAAIMNRTTGEVIGLLWGMGSKGDQRLLDSNYLWSDVVGQFHSMTWSNLSYAIMLKNLRPKLSEYLEI